MSTTLSAGARLGSPTTTCEVIVVIPPSSAGRFTCAGGELAPGASGSSNAADGMEIALGKRYEHPASGLEVLCVKSGAGPLSYAGEDLVLKTSKPLPASD